MAKSPRFALLNATNSALQSCNALRREVLTLAPRPNSARDFVQTVENLINILDSLEEAIHITGLKRPSLLILPLEHCSHVCESFQREVLTYLSRDDRDRTRFEHWSQLRYKQLGIQQVKWLLTDYTSTVEVALTPTIFHQGTHTSEQLEDHKEFVQTTTNNLRARLETIIDSQECPQGQPEARTSHMLNLEAIETEKEAIENCQKICELTTQYLSRLCPAPEVISDSNYASLGSNTREAKSVIENYGTGNVYQWMFSVYDKPLHGSNRAMGDGGHQWGGHFSNFTAREMSRDASQARARDTLRESSSPKAFDFQPVRGKVGLITLKEDGIYDGSIYLRNADSVQIDD